MLGWCCSIPPQKFRSERKDKTESMFFSKTCFSIQFLKFSIRKLTATDVKATITNQATNVPINSDRSLKYSARQSLTLLGT